MQLQALKSSNEHNNNNNNNNNAHHHHHHHRRRQKRAHSHSHAHAHIDTNANCSRRHRSVTDISSNSLNTLCTEQQLLVRRRCCTSSRTELAQYFAEDLYGSSSRRPSSCCTSSDYCYQTDSTSLYGSRSSHDSIKSGSLQQQRKKHTRYSTMSLRMRSQPTSQNGSLASIYDAEQKHQLKHSTKVHMERQISKDALSNDLPEYACSPSPIRWSFLGQLDNEEQLFAQTALSAGRKTSTASEGRERDYQRHRSRHTSWKKSVDALPSALKRNTGERECWQKSVDTLPTVLKSSCSWKKSADELPSALKRNSSNAAERERKREQIGTKPKKTSWKDNQDMQFSHAHAQTKCDKRASKTAARKTQNEFEETSNTMLYHQEAEAFNNCCSNYIQCNTYLDQDLQITSEDIHQYLNKGSHQRSINGQMYNNKNSGVQNYPFQPSNALEYQYKNNFANGTDIELDANCLCRNDANQQQMPLSRQHSTSNQNINMEAQQVKFIVNNNKSSTLVSTEAHHSGYLPYTYPSYDYTNMCSNVQTEATDEQRSNTSTSDDQHSSLLQSPEPAAVSFESFDAASEYKLLSPQTPRSASPVSSTLSAAINPAAAGPFVHHHYNYQGADYQQHAYAHAHTHPHHHHYQHTHQHLSDSFKLSHAFRNVRKRARKYTDFLRKK